MDRITAIIAGAVSLALIGVVGFLAYHGTVDGQAAMTFFSGISGVGIAAGVGHVATKTGARAAKNENQGGL